MNAGLSGPMVLAIGSRDDFLHVYRNDQELLSDDDIGAGAGELSGPLEFFNTGGYRLTGVYDRRWHLLRLTPTADPPDPLAVLRRVRNAIDHLRSFIENHPQESALYGMSVQEALQQLPRLDDSADLYKSLQAFISHPASGGTGVFGDEDDQPGLHNAAHRCGWTHG